jgi:hypothetical protein
MSTTKVDESELEMLARCDTVYNFLPIDLNTDRYLGTTSGHQRDFDDV